MKILDEHWSLQKVTETDILLRLATENSQVGIWVVDEKSKHMSRNVFYDQVFGYKSLPVDWNWTMFLEHVYPDDRQNIIEVMERATSEKRPYKIEFRVMWPNKSVHWLYVSAFVDETRHLGTIVDITEKKRMEEALNEALFYRDEFLSIASHELKTPLTSLKLQSQLFKRMAAKKDPGAFEQQRVERLIEQTDLHVSKLVSLVDDMLDISRIRTGKLSITIGQADLTEVISTAIKKVSEKAIGVKIEEPKISKSSHYLCSCDKTRIEQVVYNLLSNASRYGQGRPVEVELLEINGYYAISVIDKGIGIAPSDISKIFTRFNRAVPAREVSGFGLGLYISKEITEAHDGFIDVKSELGKGSTFTVYLPSEKGHP